jgi:UrcA family protein
MYGSKSVITVTRRRSALAVSPVCQHGTRRRQAMTIHTAIALAVAFGSIGLAAPAIAADGAATVEINAKGYDLASPDGLARLRSQGRRAAASVCRINGESDLSALIAQKNCFAKAVASVDTQIDTLRNRKMQGEAHRFASASTTTPVPPVAK